MEFYRLDRDYQRHIKTIRTAPHDAAKAITTAGAFLTTFRKVLFDTGNTGSVVGKPY